MLTPEQREKRRHFLGSSEVGRVLGFDPWGTAADVQLEKLDMVEHREAGEAATIGQYLEPSIVQWGYDQLKERHADIGPLIRDTQYEHPGGILIASLDAETATPALGRIIIESKMSGITGQPDPGFAAPEAETLPASAKKRFWEVYNAAGMHDRFEMMATYLGVPARHYAQVVSQMACTNSSMAYLAALLPLVGFRLYEIPWPEDLGPWLVDECEKWWRTHILSRVPAEACYASLDNLYRVRRSLREPVEVRPGIAEEFSKAKAAAAEAEERVKVAKQALLTAMGTGDAATVGGMVRFTFKANKKGTRSLREVGGKDDDE